MFHFPHNSDLIHQCLLPSGFLIRSLLAECFYSAWLTTFFLHCIVYFREVAFPDLSDGMEELVETALVEPKREMFLPEKKIRDVSKFESVRLSFKFDRIP